MALVTLAVIGKDNEPLYLRDFVQSRSEGEEIEKEGTGDALSKRAEDETKIETDTPLDGSSSSSVGNTFDVDDPFGFLTQELEPNESSSLKHQVRCVISGNESVACETILYNLMCVLVASTPSPLH
uniref:Uncharacterized protein n=1 Tax=Ditylum brightwellii TaxID=49249 RepID=A0A6V2DGC6_9STRA